MMKHSKGNLAKRKQYFAEIEGIPDKSITKSKLADDVTVELEESRRSIEVLKEETQEALSTKANTIVVDTALSLKADKEETQTSIDELAFQIQTRREIFVVGYAGYVTKTFEEIKDAILSKKQIIVDWGNGGSIFAEVNSAYLGDSYITLQFMQASNLHVKITVSQDNSCKEEYFHFATSDDLWQLECETNEQLLSFGNQHRTVQNQVSALQQDVSNIQTELNTKADLLETEAALDSKANQTDIETINATLDTKAEKTELQQLNTDIDARCLSIETTHNEDIQSVRNYITGAYARADNIEAYIIGDENNLKTTAKMIVPAINETYQKAADLQDALTTKADNNMVQSVVNGLDERITNLVERHSKDMETIDETLGDIETALDGIIELQNSYIGGESI